MNAIAPKAPTGASRITMPDDVEERVRRHLNHVDERADAWAQLQERQSEQHREQQHLQHFAAGEGADHGIGNDVQQKIDVLRCCDALVYADTELRSAAAGSKPTPRPGCRT